MEREQCQISYTKSQSRRPRTWSIALTTLEGLAGWWTSDTQGDSNVGGVIQFRFGDRGRIEMKVVGLVPNKHALWQVVGGPEAWIGTKVRFDLAPTDESMSTIATERLGAAYDGELPFALEKLTLDSQVLRVGRQAGTSVGAPLLLFNGNIELLAPIARLPSIHLGQLSTLQGVTRKAEIANGGDTLFFPFQENKIRRGSCQIARIKHEYCRPSFDEPWRAMPVTG